jgi:hypothetical protein
MYTAEHDDQVTICQCHDGVVIVTDYGFFPEDLGIEQTIAKYRDYEQSLVKLEDMTVAMVLLFMENSTSEELLEISKEEVSRRESCSQLSGRCRGVAQERCLEERLGRSRPKNPT